MTEKKEKTPEELAQKEVNKRVGKALANIEIKRRKLRAEIKKLDKKEKKILNGDLVPNLDGTIPDSNSDDEDEDEISSSSDSSKTNIVFLLDESGSMSSCINDTIKGFNDYIESLKKEKDKKIKFTLTKFGGSRYDVIYKNKNIRSIPKLTLENFRPSGGTPLYDAIGNTISKVKNKGKTLFVIMTDGYENSSSEFDYNGIFNLIKTQEKFGWSFVYLGADQDAWKHSKKLGLARGNTLSYCSLDTGNTYKQLIGATSNYIKCNKISTQNFFSEKNSKSKKQKNIKYRYMSRLK